MHWFKSNCCVNINRAANINKWEFVKHRVKSMYCFWSSSSAVEQPLFNLFSRLTLSSSVLLADGFFEAKSFWFSNQLWYGNDVFVPRFMACISSHLGMSAIFRGYNDVEKNVLSIQRFVLKTRCCTLHQLILSNINTSVQCAKKVNSCEPFLTLNSLLDKTSTCWNYCLLFSRTIQQDTRRLFCH